MGAATGPLALGRIPSLGFALALALAGAALEPALAVASSPAVQRGASLVAEGRYGEAETVLRAAATGSPGDGETALWLGRALLGAGKREAAVEALERAVALAPRSSVAHQWLARALGERVLEASLFARAGLAGRMRETAERAVALDPGNHKARELLLEFYLQAPAMMGGGRDKAWLQAEEMQRRDAVEGRLAKARIHQHDGDLSRAEAEYRQALAASPEHADVLFRLGLLQQAQERWGDAFTTFERLVATHPEKLNAWFQLGQLAALSGQRLERGVEAFRRYLQGRPGPGDPPPARAQLGLGQLLEKRGDLPGARREYLRALQLEPDLAGAKAALARLGR